MTQLTFSDAEYAGKRKRTRREVFLDEMDKVMPWDALLALIEPHYPKAGRGRRPYPKTSGAGADLAFGSRESVLGTSKNLPPAAGIR